jgi:hypothetical protein
MISKILRFNSSLYRSDSLRQAAKEFKKNYEGEIDFKIKALKKYTEVMVASKEDEENFLDEFSNYALFLNIK